ncbi:MAG: hypothetical protein BWY94_02225 [Actinobacteria bacterium ADurb.BinA094]|nr:MAG: hypothetical protein BWY94_02225 [Actinobacteria bacterium ADurb.BinA094]
MRAPRLVGHERDAGVVGEPGDSGEIRAQPVVGRRGDQHCLRVRCPLYRRARIFARHLERDAPGGVDDRLHVDRCGPRENESGQERLVRVARHDHGIARTAQGEQQGVDAAGGAVDEEPGAVCSPGFGGVVLGEPDEVGGLARVLDAAGHGEVDGEGRVAHEPAQSVRRALAELVAGGVERRVSRAAVAQRGVQVRRLPLVVWHVFLRGLGGPGAVRRPVPASIPRRDDRLDLFAGGSRPLEERV